MKDWKTFGLGLSIGLNIAFLAVWGFFVLEDVFEGPRDWHKKKFHDRRHREQRKHHGIGWHFYHRELDVSDSQWKKIKPRMQRFHRKAYQICQKIGRLRNELLTQIGKQNPAREKIRQLKEEIVKLRRQKQELSVKYFRNKREVLNPQQQHRFFRFLQRKPRCEEHEKFLEEEKRDAQGKWRRRRLKDSN